MESWLESFVYYFHRGFSRFTYHRNLNILFYYFGEVSFESLVIERSLSVTSSNFFLEDRISVQIYVQVTMSCLTMIGDAKENDSNFLLKIKFFRFEALFSGKTSLKYFQVQLKLTIY